MGISNVGVFKSAHAYKWVIHISFHQAYVELLLYADPSF